MNRPVADQRLLVGVALTLAWQSSDGDGTAADPGVTTVTVTASDGTVLLAAGTATSGTGTSPRTVALPANKNTQLDLLTAVWKRADLSTATTLVATVGGFYFSLAEARASDSTLADTVKYPDADLLAARRDVEDEFERVCDVAFVPRFTLETLDGSDAYALLLTAPMTRAVRSLSTIDTAGTATAYTAAQLAGVAFTQQGVLEQRTGSFAYGTANLRVGYEHGYDRPPAEIKKAALTRLRSRLNFSRSGIPDRATSYSAGAEGGTYSLARAGFDATGLDDVDAVLARYSFRVPGLA